MFILRGLPFTQYVWSRLRRASAALCMKRSGTEKVETLLVTSRRASSAVSQICADQTFMKRMSGTFFLKPSVAYWFELHRRRMQWEKSPGKSGKGP